MDDKHNPSTRFFVDMPDPFSLPRDATWRQLAIFLYQHPVRLADFVAIDLATLSPAERSALLVRVKAMLGIKPFTRKNLGYVGPNNTEGDNE